MILALLLLVLQSTTQPTMLSGSLVLPPGAGPIGTAQVVALPEAYAQAFNAEAQQRIDRYWETFKPEFAERKEMFSQVTPLAYRDALDAVMLRMRRDTKLDPGQLIRSAPGGTFELRLPAGDYKLVATAMAGGVQYVWTESIRASGNALFLQMKNRVP
jgi:hypothetical protein